MDQKEQMETDFQNKLEELWNEIYSHIAPLLDERIDYDDSKEIEIEIKQKLLEFALFYSRLEVNHLISDMGKVIDEFKSFPEQWKKK